MSQFDGKVKNLGLISSRAVNDMNFAHCFVADEPVDKIFISSKTSTNAYVFPLFFRDDDIFGKKRHPNFSQTFLTMLTAKLGAKKTTEDGLPDGLTPEDIFHYAYALFHSPGYRSRYAEFLKIDFPRLPLAEDLELFRALAGFGAELVAFHLLESPKLAHLITERFGDGAPEVQKVFWSNNTVWLDKAQTTGFRGVREDVWNFRVGGYRVCEKWLKDRKGRTLSKEDLNHYQKIIVALSETIQIMAEIDKVIDAHGGWPGAFVTSQSRG
jgi:predicted helicase